VPEQVGFAILVPKGIGSLECFDLPDSWRVIGRSLIEKEVEALSQKKEDFVSVFEYKPHKAHAVLRAFLRRKFLVEAVVSGPNWETVGISASDYVGEVTIMDSNIIHVSLGRKEY
jgi:choline kinase